ncbi:MAG TPA: septum formation initiator family protein [Candidatus Limnocylindria bacterium]|nr:septum formation initiator family protein [Candidatus Limnocylindria bacterium]
MAIAGARRATAFGPFGRRSRTRPQPVRPGRRRSGAGRRRAEAGGGSSVLAAIVAAAMLALFYLSQSGHVAATGYQITDLQARLAELRADQQHLVFQIAEARSPAVIERLARSRLGLAPLPVESVTFAERRSINAKD